MKILSQEFGNWGNLDLQSYRVRPLCKCGNNNVVPNNYLKHSSIYSDVNQIS